MNDNRLDTAVILALLVILAGVLLVLAFVPVPDKNMTLFAALASGVVGAGVGSWVGFRWGSSTSSQAKDATIASLTTKVPDQ